MQKTAASSNGAYSLSKAQFTKIERWKEPRAKFNLLAGGGHARMNYVREYDHLYREHTAQRRYVSQCCVRHQLHHSAA